MSKVPQSVIDKLAKEGIVPGAVVRGNHNLLKYTVPGYDAWGSENPDRVYAGNFWVWGGDKLQCTVITPAPASEAEGLKKGDACECGPAMRAAIIELAKELGLPTSYGGRDTQKTIQYTSNDGVMTVLDMSHPYGGERYTPEAFIARMRVTAALPKPEPPIKITSGDTDYAVTFRKGSVKIGCTVVENEKVRAIASKLID